MYPISSVKVYCIKHVEKLLKNIILCNELTFGANGYLKKKIYPHVCCCVDIIISLNVYCICMDADNTAINNIYIYYLLSIERMKENNQHNETLND